MQTIRYGLSSQSGAVAIHTDPQALRMTVLLVDPDEDNRFIYATLLRHCGYRVLEAKNGVEGILLARERRPDVIVTELFVQSAHGWKVPELLKKDPRTAQIPILALTAYAFTTDEERAWAAGCDGFLAKPCELSRVVEELQRLVEVPSNPRSRGGCLAGAV
jgi:two-component system cell cycle response regulator DivK